MTKCETLGSGGEEKKDFLYKSAQTFHRQRNPQHPRPTHAGDSPGLRCVFTT